MAISTAISFSQPLSLMSLFSWKERLTKEWFHPRYRNPFHPHSLLALPHWTALRCSILPLFEVQHNHPEPRPSSTLSAQDCTNASSWSYGITFSSFLDSLGLLHHYSGHPLFSFFPSDCHRTFLCGQLYYSLCQYELLSWIFRIWIFIPQLRRITLKLCQVALRIKNSVFIIYLLEDEQELSLGMLDTSSTYL